MFQQTLPPPRERKPVPAPLSGNALTSLLDGKFLIETSPTPVLTRRSLAKADYENILTPSGRHRRKATAWKRQGQDRYWVGEDRGPVPRQTRLEPATRPESGLPPFLLVHPPTRPPPNSTDNL